MTQKSCQHSNLKLQWRKNSQDDVGNARQRLELLRENDSIICSKEIHTIKVPQVHVYTSLCTRKASQTCTHTHTCTHAHTHTHTHTHTRTGHMNVHLYKLFTVTWKNLQLPHLFFKFLNFCLQIESCFFQHLNLLLEL